MADAIPSTELAHLLKMRIGKILKEDADYQLMYERRLARLETMRLGPSSISQQAAQAITLTNESHVLAERLAAEIRATEILCVDSPQEQLEQTIAWDERVVHAQQATVRPAVNEYLDTLRQKAYEFLRWMMSPDAVGDADRTVEESLKDYFAGESETDRLNITMDVVRLLSAFRVRDTQLGVLKHLLSLAKIYRGLLYVGVIHTEGSALERQERAKQLRNILLEIVNIPLLILGLVKATAELQPLSEPERLLPSVESAQKVEEYLTKYISTVEQWIAATEELPESMSKIRDTFEAV